MSEDPAPEDFAGLPRLVEVRVEDLRLLRPSSLALWRALVRVRDDGKMGEGEWFYADLRYVMRRARLGAYSTAKAALGQLRRAGLVATYRTHDERWIRESGKFTIVHALKQNHYLILGTCKSRSGVHDYRFPRRAWHEFVMSAGLDRVEAWSTAQPKLDRALLGDLRAFAKDMRNLCTKSGTSTKNTNLSLLRETSEKAAIAGSFNFSYESGRGLVLTPPPETFEQKLDRLLKGDSHKLPGSGLAKLCLRTRGHDGRKRTYPGFVVGGALKPVNYALLRDLADMNREPCPFRMPDPIQKPPLNVQYISPEHNKEHRAVLVVWGFRHAVREVYDGLQWWHYAKGDMKQSKGFEALSACGAMMADQSVPPEHWAIWRLKWFKANVPRFAKKPPPIKMIMSAKAVRERAGWFRKDYDLPVLSTKLDPIVNEQTLRNDEARRRWDGVDGEWVWFRQPRWYTEKRLAEIADGLTSPYDRWPVKCVVRPPGWSR